jgi:LacI family transcriptional regulator
MKKQPEVALLIETSNAYARELLHGIRSYWREHRSWTIYLPENARGQPPPAWLKNWKGDGIIARIENKRIADAVLKTKLPAVDVSAARLATGLPWVETDDDAIARLAAGHFLERGFRHFAYYSDERFNWSKWRRDSFVKYLSAAGHRCAVFTRPASATPNWKKENQALAEWISKLPKPAGILASYDNRALQLLETCRQLEIAVPDEIAVLGVNNDELLCDLGDPPLSSVIPNARRAGYEAAVLLDKMMRGQTIAPEAHLFEPIGIATRQSTDVLAVTDSHISIAVRYIREHACKGIQIEDVLRQVPLSRRIFEKRFHKAIGRTPHEQIQSVKINRVKALLTETDLPLARIAERAGFAHVEYMSVAFKKVVGMPPRDYREKNSGTHEEA